MMTPKMPKCLLTPKFTSACVLLLCMFLASALTVHAQEQSPKRGFNPGGSYAISDIETVSTTGGNLSLRVPLGGLPAGRGGMKASVNLVYNSKLWDAYPFTNYSQAGNPWEEMRLRLSDDGGWRYAFKYKLRLEYRHFANLTGYCQPEGGEAVVFIYKLFLTLPDGSKHEMQMGGPHTGSDGYTDIMPDGNVVEPPGEACPGTTPETGTLTYYSGDATFLRLEIQHDSDANWENNPWTLYLPDGGRVTGGNAPQRIYDRNNNYIEVVETLNDQAYGGHATTRLNDESGRSVVVEYNSAPNQDSVHVQGTNNQQVTTTVVWAYPQVDKLYQAGTPGKSHNLSAAIKSVSQIILPAQAGGLSYIFGYNTDTANPSDGWGEVSSVMLPSGAKASYQYLQDGVNNTRTQAILSNHPTRKDLVYRREYDGTAVSNTPCNTQTEITCATETTTYGITFDASGAEVQDGWVTAPDGGVARDYVTAGGDVYKSERPDGTVVERQWQSNIPYGSLYAINSYVKREFTSIKDAAGNLTKTAIREYNQDKNGNTTQVKEYDWVAYASLPRDTSGRPNAVPGGASLKRVTTSSYYGATPDAADTTNDDADAYYNSTAPRVRSAVASSETGDGTQTLSRSEFYYDNAATTGNLTQQKGWDSTKGDSSNPANYVSTSTQYNVYGSPILTTDARGTQTQYTYGAVGDHTDLYPTIIKAAFGTTLEQVTTLEYDFYTGAVTRSTDSNGVATATTYDDLGRAVLVKVAEGIAAKESHSATDYSDANRRVIVRSDLTNMGDAKLVSIQHYDQMGRVRLSRTLEDSATQSATDETKGVKVQTRYLYSGSNSYQLVSNPYRAQYSHLATNEPSMGWTRGKADNGGRSVEAQTFNGATLPAPWDGNASSSGIVTTGYDAEYTTVTDQAGKARRSMINGIGQLARVDEPDKDTGSLGSTSSPVQPTSYSYDTLGNLTEVTQGTQAPRTFNYSSLSRLTSATNPESGTTSYTYDEGGNLKTKTDARAYTLTYVYDALSRNKTVDYSNTTISPDIERYYDNPAAGAYGRGRFWKDYKGGNDIDGSEVEHRAVDAYDALGRPLSQRQKFKTGGVWSSDYTTSRTYTRSGNVELQTLPSGHTVNHTYDTAGRLQSFDGNLGDGTSRTYSSGILYEAGSRIAHEQFGTNTPLYHRRHYNTRGQLYDVRLTSEANSDGFSWNRGAIVAYYDSAYSWTNNGNAPTLTDNNGNVRRAQVWIPGDDAMSTYTLSDEYFDYDALNRLKSVNEYKEVNGPVRTHAFIQTHDYDRWGNRTINQAGTTQPEPNRTLPPGMNRQFAVDTATNRLLEPGDLERSESARWMRYDDVGNLTEDIYTGKGARTYDAENRMTSAVIGINSSANYTYDADGRRVRRQTPNEQVWQVYGLEGELLAEYAANAAPTLPQKEYGYRNGELLVTATSGGSSSGGGGSGSTAATFLRSDTTTLGSWKGAYGADGYSLAGDGVSYPAYAQVSISGHQSHTWVGSTTHARALWKSATGSTDRILATWFSSTNYTIDINLTDGQEHQVALYALDWDGNDARAMRVEALDAATNAVLGSRDVTAYSGGQYLVWKLRGHVKLKVIYTGPAGSNATVSGLFFDPAATAVNLAQGQTATQSSTEWGGYAARAVDGNTSGDWNYGSVTHTGTEGEAWWQVDLGSVQQLGDIKVWNRTDCCGAALANFYVFVSDDPFTATSTTATLGQAGVTAYQVTGQGGTPTVVEANRTGRYVRVQLTAYEHLSVAEVQVFAAGGSAAPAGEVNWLVSDHLGTPRMIADLSGSLAGIKRHDYLPFGEEIQAGIGGRTTGQGYVADNVRQQFTGYERDDETGLDYAQARYYSNVQGRFTSVDPALSSGKPTEPQSWNRYTYVLNNPLLYTDPTGLIWGYQDFTENGKNKRRFQWFDGDTVGEGFTTYKSEHYVGSDEVVWLSSVSNNHLRISKDRFTDEQFALLRSAQGADSTSFNQEQLDTVNRGIALTIGGTWQYGLMKGAAGAAGGIAGGLGAASNFTFGAASRQASRLPPVLFHYTDEAGAAAIQATQLGRANRSLFLTNNGALTPLQAQLELSLPAQNAPQALFAIDSQALTTSNLLRSGRVTGNVFGRPGGGTEFMFREGTTVPQGSFTRFRF